MTDLIRATRSGASRALVVTSVLALAACAGQQQDQAPGPDLTSTITEVTYGLQSYLVHTGEGARELRLEAAALDSRPIDAATLAGSLSPEGLRARVQTLVLLNAYITKLGALTEDDIPTAELETSKTLDPRVAALPQTFQRLGASDTTASSYAAPVTALLGWVGQTVPDTGRAQALSDALATAAPAADTLLDLLAADVKRLQDQRVAEAGALMEREQALYNGSLRRLSLADRRALVETMQSANQARAIADTPVPQTLITQLKRVHAAMIAYVRSGRTRSDEETLDQAIGEFQSDSEPLLATLRASE